MFPGLVVDIFLINGFHGRGHSEFLTEFCLEGVSLIVWSVVAFAVLSLNSSRTSFVGEIENA